MSEDTQAPPLIDLSTVSEELRRVIEFDKVPEQMHAMVASIHQASENAVREAWGQLPASAQNILDNFEQFHALVSVSQAFAGLSVIEELQTQELSQTIADEDKEAYQADVIEKVMHNCIKDMLKQIKKARRDPLLKREFTQVFAK
ncbi:DUF3069 domain-containing protein [Vibrio sp. OCN044]|uniref:DUF3069 domain-containing protein n=1 Tax=Vibrio tetraodonis subsp. pristinus TaxID=2695891 RepID=A0A6L8LZN7_9VIBR|nr:DUF3069 domain-containing protein [Vibrio tetraodonis]MYM58759.1 DUF3069 domain-containing protein [Vibrio tetraodonis subsp. pristinus]